MLLFATIGTLCLLPQISSPIALILGFTLASLGLASLALATLALANLALANVA